MGSSKRTPVELVRDSSDPDVLATFERVKGKVGVVNIHRTIANSPAVFTHFIAFAYALRHQTVLDPRERELAILCVLQRHEGDYELAAHRQIALGLGLSAAQVENVCRASEHQDLYTTRQHAVLRFAERFAASPASRDALAADRIEDFLNNRERVELALTLALYLGLSRFTGLLDVPPEDAASLDHMRVGAAGDAKPRTP